MHTQGIPEYVAITEALADPKAVVREWLAEVSGAAGATRAMKTTDATVDEGGEIARAVFEGLRAEGDVGAFEGIAWERLRGVLESLSSCCAGSRGSRGFASAAAPP